MEIVAEQLEAVMPSESGLDLESLMNMVERPRDRKMGDWAFPCFSLASVFRRTPAQIAESLVNELTKNLTGHSLIASVTATGPYLNFTINKAVLAKTIVPDIQNGVFLKRRAATGQRIMIEYSQPNTHKAFHVGHMRNVALGDALARIVNWEGNDVLAVNYIGDVGTHIAKCLWYMKNYYQGPIPDENRGEFLGDMYRNASLLLDFSSLSLCPVPGLKTARVLSITPTGEEGKNKIVSLEAGDGKYRVLCGGTGYKEGSIVAYAPVGMRLNGKLIKPRTVHGIHSEGMLCSGKELGLSEDRNAIYLFKPGTETGLEVAEVLRRDDALEPSQSVLAVMRERTEGVSNILQDLEAGEPQITALWQETKAWSMEAFHEIYEWLDARFDHYFFESDVGHEGKELVEEFYRKGLFIESQGTIGMDLTNEKLPFFMLLKSDGTGLYSTKDLALAKKKFEEFHIDQSVYVVDASQSLHFQQVFATLKHMGFPQADACYHLAYGLVVLKEGKMSSRGGTVILFSELRSTLDTKIRNDYLNKYQGEWSEQEIKEASRKISIATIRYGMLNNDQTKNTVFNLNDWTSKSGNTGPYLLYAYARIASLLEKAKMMSTGESGTIDWNLLQSPEEASLISHLAEFPETVSKSASEHRPQLICIYLYQLAKAFSRMYDRVSILKAENDSLRETRLKLISATGKTLKKGLELIGIQTLERM
jgi:arginyl-tRNA synthetase